MERDPETATALYRGVCLVPARRRKTDALKWAARSLPYGRLSLARFFFSSFLFHVYGPRREIVECFMNRGFVPKCFLNNFHHFKFYLESIP